MDNLITQLQEATQIAIAQLVDITKSNHLETEHKIKAAEILMSYYAMFLNQEGE